MTKDIPAQNKCANIKLKLNDDDVVVVTVVSLLLAVVFVVVVSAVIFNLLSCSSLVVIRWRKDIFLCITVQYGIVFLKLLGFGFVRYIWRYKVYRSLFVFPGGFAI